MKQPNRQLDKWMNSQPAQTANLIDVSQPMRLEGIEAIAPAVFASVLVLIAAYGFAVGSLPIGWGGIGAAAIFTIVYFVTLAFGGTRFYIERQGDIEVEPEPARAFINSERKKQKLEITGRMRSFLSTLAEHYGEVETMAIGAWYRSEYLKRNQIETVRDWLVLKELADSDENNQVTLRPWTIEQLPRWAAGDYEGLVELNENRPTPPAS